MSVMEYQTLNAMKWEPQPPNGLVNAGISFISLAHRSSYK